MKTIPLKQLATKIKAEHEQVIQTVRKSLEHAKKAGELLSKAQKQVTKDTAFKWGRWVEQECGVKERTASNYIRLFKNWSKIEKAGDVSTLTVRAALAILKKRTRQQKAKHQQLTLNDLGGLMEKHGIKGQPHELVALLEEIGLKVPVATEKEAEQNAEQTAQA
ncbi:MAG: hypothetical protein FJ271_18950 [Planctomycetes bacterium]|nr:hypothetical protein [Planctomycetota bacterium]